MVEHFEPAPFRPGLSMRTDRVERRALAPQGWRSLRQCLSILPPNRSLRALPSLAL